ncbi:hypothetical protein DITRI_Ditri09bG0018400 [Diplodiscus trichospermus]
MHYLRILKLPVLRELRRVIYNLFMHRDSPLFVNSLLSSSALPWSEEMLNDRLLLPFSSSQLLSSLLHSPFFKPCSQSPQSITVVSQQFGGEYKTVENQVINLADLLSQDENTLATSTASELSQWIVNGKEPMDGSQKDADSLLENGICAGHSDFKKGRLKGLLRQSMNDHSMEVDEMLDPVVGMCPLRFRLRSNSLVTSALDGDAAQVGIASKKPKMSSSCSSTSIAGNSCPIKSGSWEEVIFYCSSHC